MSESTFERQAVKNFSRAMEETLRENDYKGGWDNESFKYLLESLKHEVKELEEALINWDDLASKSECLDIANFAMMIYDNITRKCKTTLNTVQL